MTLQLFSQTYGTEGTPLVILHGFLGASGNWHTLSRKVFAEKHRVFTLDLRNHGRSPHAEVFDYPSMVEDVRQFIISHNLEGANIIGHSMGGKVAMWLALTYPELVSRLVVADMAPRQYPAHHMHILNALKNLDLASMSSRNEIDEALAEDLGDFGVRQFLLKNLASEGAGNYRWKMNLPVLYSNYGKINTGIEVERVFEGPALFIKGGKSNYIKPEDQPRIQKLFPAATVREIPGIGHWVHAEAPGPFGEMVLDFLK